MFVSDERDAIQKKTFTKWVNKHLAKVSLLSSFGCIAFECPALSFSLSRSVLSVRFVYLVFPSSSLIVPQDRLHVVVLVSGSDLASLDR